MTGHEAENSQPRVNDLRTGKLHLFSLETLVQMLRKLGTEVAIIVTDPAVDDESLLAAASDGLRGAVRPA